MALRLENLDARTRRYMLEEVDRDVAAGTLYIGRLLNDSGKRDYPGLLKTAIESGNDATLAEALRIGGRFRPAERRRDGSEPTTRSNAAEMLAEGEFNRFYIRGVCRRAIDDGISEIEVYRARYSENPRDESAHLVGKRYVPADVLDDLRANPGRAPKLGVPPGPNSGLSVRLPPHPGAA